MSARHFIEALREQREPPMRRGPLRELLDHGAFAERPVGEIDIAQPDLATAALCRFGECSAYRGMELGAGRDQAGGRRCGGFIHGSSLSILAGLDGARGDTMYPARVGPTVEQRSRILPERVVLL